MLTHTPRRFLVMLMVLVGLLSFAGLQLASQPAAADALVTLQSCSPASGGGGGVTCNLQLMVSVNPGGVWKATVNDSGATVSACDGSAASATCTTSSNTATFTCSTGCAQNSKVTITVQGDAHPENVYFTSLYAGSLTSGNGPTTTVSATIQPGYGPYGPVTGQVLPAQVLPQGGMCVGASYPSPYGCTSAYVSVPTITYGGYSGCYGGFYTYGCGYQASYNTPFYGNCGGFVFIGGCSNFYFNCGNGNFFNRCGNNGCFNGNWWGCGNNNGCVSIFWHCGNNGCWNGGNWNCGNMGNNGCWGGNWGCGNNGDNDHHFCGNQQGQQGMMAWTGHNC